MLSIDEFDKLSRAEKLTALRRLDDQESGMASRPSPKEIQAYRDEGRTPPAAGSGPFRTPLSSLQTDLSPLVVDSPRRR
ncbi:hypothetical protein [Nocardia sp. BMG111209]|uniref:hypothetical protein n=1 Tax=Nocardia sp. BMG111209 TaxID=1160137 RepID=UPI000364CD35|nr:hypothetical protein [Nocardia sp. BMG111209]